MHLLTRIRYSIRLPEGAAKGTAFYEYKSDESSGAVLITMKPISSRGFLHESPFTRWVHDNIDALMASPRSEEIKRHGLAVIRDTHSTKKCLMNVWESGKRAFSVGLTVDAHGALDLGVSGGWSHATESGGWREFSPKVSLDWQMKLMARSKQILTYRNRTQMTGW